MKKITALLTTLSLFTLLHAQPRNLTLSAPESGTKVHTARDGITFLPGYSYQATGNNTMLATVNEQLVVPVEYQSQQPSSTRQLNTSYAVGATAGTADVTPAGAAVYQIPVAIPPGTAGVQPSLSIVYNSQTGNGLLGYGWNLAAISCIARCGKTFYHDGKTDAVRLDNTDNLMLDGQRLMLVAGTHFTGGAEYRTEIETFNVIKYKTIGSSLCFEVKNRDGWTLEYGTTTDSYIETPGSSTALCWLLARVTDPSGNYMTYSYTEDGATGEFRLKRIDYTGNTGLPPYNTVEFFYETRSDRQTAYMAGKALKQTVLLKRLRASSASTTFREYRFNYYFDGMYSKLTEVEEYGQGGVRYNSTVISPGNQTFTGENLPIFLTSPKSTEAASIYSDFNADGTTDFITYPIKGSYTGSDKATLYIAYDYYDPSFSKTSAAVPLISGFERLLAGDMDGDGLCDAVRIHKSGNTYYYYIYLYKNGAFTPHWKSFTSSGGECLIGDFDGDGKQDIFFRTELNAFSCNGVKIADGGISAANAGIDYLPGVFPNSRYVMNLTGSGKTSLLTLSGSSCKVFELNGNTFGEITGFATADVTNRDGIIPGDYNGDGLTDLLIQRSNLYYYILFSTGKSFVRVNLPDLQLYSLTLPGDINRDGKTDIVQIYAMSNDASGYNAKMYTRTGTYNGSGFSFKTYEYSYIPVWKVLMVGRLYDPNTGKYLWQPFRPFFALEDFNGDGRCEIVFDDDNDVLYYKSFNDNLLLQTASITDGLNRRTAFTYRPMTSMYIYSEAAQSYTFPVITASFPLCLTESVRSTSDAHSNETRYWYTGARFHRQGKGFLGFEQVEASNYRKNRRTTTEYGYNPYYYNVYPTKQKVETDRGTATAISTTNYTHSYLSMGAKRIFPYMLQQTAIDHLSGLSVATLYHHQTADHGNPWKITETRGSMVTETTNTWAAKGGSIYKNRLIESTVKKSGLQGTFTHTVGMEYDAKGRLASQVNWKGTDKAVTTLYSGFDVFGNPQTVTTTATGCPTITVTAGYDRYGRPASRTDVIGTVTTGYDHFGRVTSQTNIDGTTAHYSYDGFGNLTGETTPTGSVTHSLVWNIAANQLYRTVRTEDGAPTQMAWYDAAGREVMARIKGFSGDIYTAKEYDFFTGAIYRNYLPGYGSASSRYTEYAYDEYGRTASETSISGTTNYSYSGLTTGASYPDGTFKTTLLNTSGLVQSVTDGGGTVSYTYNSMGKPVTINAAGLATTIGYDSRGYQTALKDPNMSNTAHYSYDAYGQLRSHTNARGQATTFTYDAAGRPLTEQRPGSEGTLAYSYVASGNGKGRLQSISMGGATVRSIAYNPLGLPQSITETIDGTAFTTSYTYDGKGRLLQKTSPSGFKLLHIYNSDGYLTALRDGSNNANIWMLNALNAFGQVTQSTAGNGLVRNTSFSTTDFTLESITLKNGTSVMDNVTYNFDATSGNLLQRNDVTNSRNELFGYDALNRLNSIKLNSAAPQTISYAANGNITSKYDVGTYSYNNNNHAVSGVQSFGYTPPNPPVRPVLFASIKHT
ncbi:MAG: FG-GAP-like repeat-containing protein, partial [Cytophagaceae bacterium]|nr:FG-GAP-like repeat-containing protein [Cytophagaceae bacterium]